MREDRDGSWMRVWDLAQGETAGLSPTGVMDIDSSWARHQSSVSPVAEEAEVQTVTGEVAEARNESCRVAAARKNAARVRDDPTLNQAIACISRER